MIYVFTVSLAKIFSTTVIRGLCRFPEPGLISSITFEEKLGLANVNDWKEILRSETSPKFF